MHHELPIDVQYLRDVIELTYEPGLDGPELQRQLRSAADRCAAGHGRVVQLAGAETEVHDGLVRRSYRTLPAGHL